MKTTTAAAAALLAAASLALAGCNTVQGLGKDISKGAEHVGSALEKAGDKLTEVAGGTPEDEKKSAQKSAEKPAASAPAESGAKAP